jgi:AcrR family transcriptional regulator
VGSTETPGPPAPLSRRRAQTRERLLIAARSVFGARGVYGASVEDICEAAGFTRGAFYSNFASKEDLFFALQEHDETSRFQRIHNALEQPPPQGEDMLDELVLQILDSQPVDRQWLLIHTEFELHSLRNAESGRRLSQAWAEFCAQVEGFLQDGLAMAGRRLTVDPADAVAALVAVFESSIKNTLIGDPDAEAASTPDLARRILPVMLRSFTEPIP